MSFALGQRWVSDTESDLGLGTVVGIEGRMITIMFPASGETRLYASTGAPITRVLFNIGDTIKSADDWKLTVHEVDEIDGLVVYHGTRLDAEDDATVSLMETRLDHFITFNNPQDRLFAGQIDRFDRFNLRYQCWQHINAQQKSPILGLAGVRASLIPHQLYIAQEVGQRHAPRVLLADEVGLGKTIEAGLIIHQQVITGRAKRVLIVVPESLQHQWLVEMLRRFNLHFSIFDLERCNETINEAANPFETEQLVLTSLEFFTAKKQWFEQAAQAEWDLLIVDEAHHLVWEKDNPSTEYQRIEALSKEIKGLILLTATPDQLGHESHFARLRLLDPDRFYDYQKFVEEESHYTEVADAANDLLDGEQITDKTLLTLRNILSESDIESSLEVINSNAIEHQKHAAKKHLIQQLLDRHGTGRILFRNTRHSVQGFPERQLLPHAMTMPAQYKTAISVASKFNVRMSAQEQAQQMLFPEQVFSDFEGVDSTWSAFDPRVTWLIDTLKELKREKLIVICAHAQTAMTLEKALWSKEAIKAAVFHEGLSVFERDKAAAYFAQEDDSAQVLICSEIGSEGRNFQFSHHLVLFDLPLNPDLLEQRIGRLDRIGQTQTIKVHVPYFADTAQSVLFDWFNQGLDAFNYTCNTGRAIFEQYNENLFDLMKSATIDSTAVNNLIEQTQESNKILKVQLEQGRDKLLELNSSGQHADNTIAHDIAKIEQAVDLPIFMIKIFDTFGIDQEDNGEQSIILRPTEHMLVPSFPYVDAEGCTVTFNRELALAQEHIHFLSWEHPMVQGALDLVTNDDIGNTSVAIFKNKALPAGAHFVEFIYIAQSMAPSELQIGRYFPTTPVRVLLDKSNNSLGEKISYQQFNSQLSPIGKKIASQLTAALQTQISAQVPMAHKLAEQSLVTLQSEAMTAMEASLGEALERLTALKKINPNIREDELEFVKTQQQQLSKYIGKAELKLDAVRLIVVTHG
ncbi:MAG: RNA polymerase-associated protein RapA [Algicola sp.]|nr:RNA polymerase-associated protein RapA [Algicola sp.]